MPCCTGRPEDSGISLEIIAKLGPAGFLVFGVCMGHQCIGQVYIIIMNANYGCIAFGGLRLELTVCMGWQCLSQPAIGQTMAVRCTHNQRCVICYGRCLVGGW
jgi:anthranilate/para-aminobenzoate synthase component II